MNYHVYTDGAYSVERGVGSWAYLIYTDTNFIEWVSNKTKHIASPTYAEDIAIGVASHSLLKLGLTKEDNVYFYTDSLATIELIERYITSNRKYVNKNILVQDAIRTVQELSELTNVEMCKVLAHKNSLNPNICVDRMAKYALRS